MVTRAANHLSQSRTGRQEGLDLLRRGDHRLDHRLRIADIGILHGDADDRTLLRRCVLGLWTRCV